MNKKIYILSVVFLIVDQITKSIVNVTMDVNQTIKVIRNFFYITNLHNSGAAWGILSNRTTLLIIFTIITLIIIYRYMYTFKPNTRNILAFGLLTGGIIGNLIDRLFLSYVRDFFSFYIFNYPFPVFNVSDMCTVAGVVLLIFSILKGDDKIEKSKSRK